MNTKILLTIFLPHTGKTYDIWTPRELSVYKATQYIGQLLAEREQRYFLPTDTTALYDGASGSELRADRLVGELGLGNGARLILV